VTGRQWKRVCDGRSQRVTRRIARHKAACGKQFTAFNLLTPPQRLNKRLVGARRRWWASARPQATGSLLLAKKVLHGGCAFAKGGLSFGTLCWSLAKETTPVWNVLLHQDTHTRARLACLTAG